MLWVGTEKGLKLLHLLLYDTVPPSSGDHSVVPAVSAWARPGALSSGRPSGCGHVLLDFAAVVVVEEGKLKMNKYPTIPGSWLNFLRHPRRAQ